MISLGPILRWLGIHARRVQRCMANCPESWARQFRKHGWRKKRCHECHARALAVQKLAAAYKADEIASSVMVMQGGGVFDDVAERVLRRDTSFCHLRLPSSEYMLLISGGFCQLPVCTAPTVKWVLFDRGRRTERVSSRGRNVHTSHQRHWTQVLHEVTAAHPQRLEYYRTRGVEDLMLGELPTLLTTLARSAVIIDGLEGYPIFLPPKSMAQAEFIEVLERLASGWKVGIQPHSAMRAGPVANRLAIEPPPVSPSSSLLGVVSSSSGDTTDSLSTPFASRSSAAAKATIPPLPNAPGCDASAIKQAPAALVEALDCARISLVPVAARQRERASRKSVQ